MFDIFDVCINFCMGIVFFVRVVCIVIKWYGCLINREVLL